MAIDPGRVKVLFQKAIELDDPETRRAWLDREIGDDAESRRRLDALLAAFDRPPDALERPLAADLAATAAVERPSDGPETEPEPTVADVSTISIGAGNPRAAIDSVIAGRYKIRQAIGEGGMGTVYLAEQTRPVKRQVALKLIKPGMDSRQVLARFESERQALALMDHPHIAHVLDAGTTDDGRPFFVMELVKGIPLTEYCDHHRLDLPARLALFGQICSAVQHAHQKGIIHRDLKPTNILVESHDGKPVPKVIDFGLAKATSGMQLSEHSLFTAFGSVTGTPLYMAPEQATFNALDVDTRADIYALGVILYELLTGSTPIQRDTMRRAALDEMLRVIREVEPPTPSNRISTSEALPSLAANRHVEPARLSRLVRGELDWIVMKALAKERDRRYESAVGLANDLERFLNHEPVSAGPPTAAYRMRKFVRRNRSQVAGASLVLLALVLGVIGTTVGLFEARRQSRRAEAQRQKAEARLGQVAKMNEILGSIFGDINPYAAEKEGTPLRAVLGERLDRATAEIEGEATGDPLAVARMQMVLGHSQGSLGYPAKAVTLLNKARATFTAELGADHPETLNCMRMIAHWYLNAGEYKQAIQLGEETLARMQARLGRDHPETIHCMTKLAASYREDGERRRAIELGEEALRLAKARFGPGRAETLLFMKSLAASYGAAKQFDRAIPLAEEALALQRRQPASNDFATLGYMQDLALIYGNSGQLDRAIPLTEETLAGYRANVGSDHPSTLNTMTNLATLYWVDGRLDRALKLREEVLPLSRAKLGPDNPDTLQCMQNLAISYFSAGQFDRALKLREETLALQKAKLGPTHPDALNSMHNLALSYRQAGRIDREIEIRTERLALARAKYGPDHGFAVTCLRMLAQAVQDAGQFDRAEPLWDELVANRRKALGDGHADTLAARLDRADLDLVRGRLDVAEPVYLALLTECRARLGPDHANTAWAEASLADLYLKRGDRAAAVPLLRSCVDRARKLPAKSRTPLDRARESALALTLLDLKRWPEAEASCREALVIDEPTVPDDLELSNFRSLLGGALFGQGKVAEAEPLLRAGYEEMSKRADEIPAVSMPRLAEALDRLIAFGEATGKADEVKAWKAERGKLDAGARSVAKEK